MFLLTTTPPNPPPPLLHRRINSYTAMVGNKQVLNLASADFLGLGDHEGIQVRGLGGVGLAL
jgi:7-keto-8-aminopelargonate synthetase-like enzyme